MTFTNEPDDLADAAIEEYLRLVDAGEEIDRAAFIANHAEVAGELRSFFGGMNLLEQFAGSGGPPDETRTESITRVSRLISSSEPNKGTLTDRLPWASLPAVFGRYRVEKLLGRGGMGAVYRAYDKKLGRPVALKLPHVLADAEPELQKRLLREARAVAILSHKNICRVHDVGVLQDTPFIAMEFIEGRSLSEIIRNNKPVPLKTAVVTIRKLAMALEAAHGKGIVHRDLKPLNIMIKPDSEPVLMDFGLAQREVSTGEERLTKKGVPLGTLEYMSPEQTRADQEAIGPASDIYGLGVIFYQLLTGQLPFTGSDYAILLKVQYEEPPSPQQLRSDMDLELSEICLKMLEKAPEDRFASMQQVVDVLQQWLKEEQQTKTAVNGFNGIGRLILFIVVIVVVASVGICNFVVYPLKSVPIRVDDLQAVLLIDNQHIPLNGGAGVVELRAGLHQWKVLMGGNSMKSEQFSVSASLVNLLDIHLHESERDVTEVRSKERDSQLHSKNDPVNEAAKNDKQGVDPKEDPVNPNMPNSEFAAVQPSDSSVLQDSKRMQSTVLAPNLAAPHASDPASLVMPQFITNSIRMKLVLIPPGTFAMGSPKSEKSHEPSEGPRHSVQITRPFYMGVYEVTQNEFELVMGANPSHFSINGGGSGEVRGKDTNRFPVENVSWYDAIDFCRKLSEKDGLSACYSLTNDQRENGSIKSANVLPLAGNGYRLPTEAEWEYACRGGTTTPFNFGGVLNGDNANVAGNSPYGTTKHGIFLRQTTTVGSYRKNKFGLFDMHGNVVEWCFDVFDEKAYSSRSGTTMDPIVTSGSEFRLLRGGFWSYNAKFARSAYRNRNTPSYRNEGTGFRVVR